MSVSTSGSYSTEFDDGAAPAIRMPAMANQDFRRTRQERVRRHSRLVRRMRVVLPSTGIAMALAVIGYSIVMSALPDFDLGVLSIETDGLVMTSPRLAGHSEKGRAYVVEAERAVQPLDDTDIVHLEKVKAFSEMSDGDEATMTAEAGHYRSDKEFLELRKDIVVVTKSGYTIRSEAADIDLEAGTMRADSEVTIVSDELDLRADAAEVSDQGKVITFRGNVKIIWQRKPPPQQ
jgi:lipopolysaccharide export system protein LptC